MKSTYDESSIEVIKGLAAIRKRPSMYLGPRGDAMLLQMLKEPVDNCLDEALEGRNDYIEVRIDCLKDEFYVIDHAEGIPVGVHAQEKKSTLEVVMTTIHAGGKFGKGYKQATAGTHGVGVAAVNALSAEFEVWTYRDGWHYQRYVKGEPQATVARAAPTKVKPLIKNFRDRGTIVRYTPDHSLVDDEQRARIRVKEVAPWLKTLSLMNKGLRIVLTVINSKGETSAEFLNKEGPTLLVTRRIKALGVDPLCKPFVVDTPFLTCALVYTNADSDQELQSFVNTSPTKNGGTHVRGFTAALAKAVGEHKKKNQKLETRDLMLGMIGLLNVKVKEPEFKGQTKEELVSPISKAVEDALTDDLAKFFRKNRTLAKDIIRKAIELKDSREQFRKVVQTISGVKKARKVLLPGILTTARCDPSKRDLYIVEGSSAAGCFLGGTQVALINGESKTLKRLVKEAEQGIVNYGFAHSSRTGRVEVVPIEEPRLVKHTCFLTEVTLDNGETVTCTRNHRWKLRDGTYVEAQDLRAGDKLMPFRQRLAEQPQVFCPALTGVCDAAWLPLPGTAVLEAHASYVTRARNVATNAPVPVYDASIDHEGLHNYALAAGVFVHNTAKLARDSSFQEVFKLTGKSLNAVRATVDKLMDNKVIQNLFVALGIDIQNLDAKTLKVDCDKLRVNRVLLLADADEDGPLVGGTRVLTPDGRNPTIAELADEYQAAGNPIPVYALDAHGGLVEALANDPRVYVTADQITEVTFLDGFVARCTASHKWSAAVPEHDPRVVRGFNHRFVRACDLRPGDDVLGVDGHGLACRRGVASVATSDCAPTPMYCMTVPDTGNFLVSDGVGGVCSANSHVSLLVLTVLYKYFPDLIKQGRVFVVDAPLFHAFYKNKHYFGATHEECYKSMPKGAPSNIVIRAKGWGESSPETLRVVAFDPETRGTIQVTWPDSKAGVKHFERILGQDTAVRKQLLGL